MLPNRSKMIIQGVGLAFIERREHTLGDPERAAARPGGGGGRRALRGRERRGHHERASEARCGRLAPDRAIGRDRALVCDQAARVLLSLASIALASPPVPRRSGGRHHPPPLSSEGRERPTVRATSDRG
jgi:hypothetical protein